MNDTQLRHSKIKKQKNLALYDVEIIKEIQKPIGKAIYTAEKQLEQASNPHWSDIIKCKVCGKKYKRSNVSAHKKTQIHQTYLKIDQKLHKILLE